MIINYSVLDRDDTEIGERGVTLSGGQKQRLNIARAVFVDADVILLDDPLSAVDSHVGRHLFEKCFLGALQGKTRLLVTHQLHFLPQVDRIIVMDKGHIAEIGTYKELMEKNGSFASLMRNYGGADEEEDVEEAELIQIPVETFKSHESHDHLAPKPIVLRLTKSKQGKQSELKKELPKTLMTAEERATGAVGLNEYRLYLKAAGGWYVAVIILFVAISAQVANVMNGVWLSWWSSRRMIFHFIETLIPIRISTIRRRLYGCLCCPWSLASSS